MTTVDERVAELIAKAPPLTPEQIAGAARIIVRHRARERAALKGGGSRATA